MKFIVTAKWFIKSNWLLIIIFIIALLLRLQGADFGLPQYYLQPDERRLVEPAIHMVVDFAYTHDLTKLDPKMYVYPHGGLNIFFIVYLFIFYSLKIIDKLFNIYPPLFNLLAESDLFLIARVVVAMFGSFIVLVAYKIAKTLNFNKSWALFYALLIAVSFGLVSDSHFATANSISIFMGSLSTLFCLIALQSKLNKKKVLLYLFMAAFLVGVATSIRNMRVLYFIQIFIVFLAVFKKDYLNLFKYLFVSVFFVILATLIFSPFVFINSKSFIEDGILGIQEVQKGGQLGRTSTGIIYPFFNNNFVDYDQKIPNSLAKNMGVITFVTSVLFICYKLYKKREVEDLVLLSVAVIQILFLIRYPSQMVRWYLNIIPILLIYFTYFSRFLYKKNKLLFIVLALFVVSTQLFYSFEFSFAKTKKDTRELLVSG